jgi:cell division protease FtsH
MDVKIKFDDVAGVDEAKEELKEVVEFLKTPDRFQRLGGQDPQRGFACGSAGDGKDAIGPRCGR